MEKEVIRIDYEQYIKDYFYKRGLQIELTTRLQDEWAFLGRQYKNLDADMFLSGLEASCLEEGHQKHQQHIDRLIIKQVVYRCVSYEIISDIFESTLGIIKNCSDPGFIATCLKEIRQDWTDESSRDELLQKYKITPRKQIIAAKLAEINKEAPVTSQSLFSAPKPKLASSHECAPSP